MSCDHTYPSGHRCGRRTETIRRRLVPFRGGPGVLVESVAWCARHDLGSDLRPLFEPLELVVVDLELARVVAAMRAAGERAA